MTKPAEQLVKGPENATVDRLAAVSYAVLMMMTMMRAVTIPVMMETVRLMATMTAVVSMMVMFVER